MLSLDGWTAKIDLVGLARRHPLTAAAAAMGVGAIVALHNRYARMPDAERGRLVPFAVGLIARAGKAAFGEMLAEGYEHWRSHGSLEARREA